MKNMFNVNANSACCWLVWFEGAMMPSSTTRKYEMLAVKVVYIITTLHSSGCVSEIKYLSVYKSIKGAKIKFN